MSGRSSRLAKSKDMFFTRRPDWKTNLRFRYRPKSSDSPDSLRASSEWVTTKLKVSVAIFCVSSCGPLRNQPSVAQMAAIAEALAASLVAKVVVRPEGLFVSPAGLKQWLSDHGLDRPPSFLNRCLTGDRVSVFAHGQLKNLYDIDVAPIIAEFFGFAFGIVDWSSVLQLVRDRAAAPAAEQLLDREPNEDQEPGGGVAVAAQQIVAFDPGDQNLGPPPGPPGAIVPVDPGALAVAALPAVDDCIVTVDQVRGMDRQSLEALVLSQSKKLAHCKKINTSLATRKDSYYKNMSQKSLQFNRARKKLKDFRREQAEKKVGTIVYRAEQAVFDVERGPVSRAPAHNIWSWCKQDGPCFGGGPG